MTQTPLKHSEQIRSNMDFVENQSPKFREMKLNKYVNTAPKKHFEKAHRDQVYQKEHDSL